MKTKYVVGVPYCGDFMMLQAPPVRTGELAYLNGLLNGIGGHLEINESPGQAMSREWQEETGRLIERTRWERVYGEEYEKSLIYFYVCRVTEAEAHRVLTRKLEQQLYMVNFDELSKVKVVPSIKILAAMIGVGQQGYVPPLNIF